MGACILGFLLLIVPACNYIVRALINVPNVEIKLRGRKKNFRLGALGMRKTASVARYIQISLYL